MPSKKRKYNARFPPGRIKKIMQTDEEIGKVAQAVPVLISRTLELFVESLLTKALDITNIRNAKTLTPSHMKQCILSEHRFDFLKDLVKDIPDTSNEEYSTGDAKDTNACALPHGATLSRTNSLTLPSTSSLPSTSNNFSQLQKRLSGSFDSNNTNSKHFKPSVSPPPLIPLTAPRSATVSYAAESQIALPSGATIILPSLLDHPSITPSLLGNDAMSQTRRNNNVNSISTLNSTSSGGPGPGDASAKVAPETATAQTPRFYYEIDSSVSSSVSNVVADGSTAQSPLDVPVFKANYYKELSPTHQFRPDGI